MIEQPGNFGPERPGRRQLSAGHIPKPQRWCEAAGTPLRREGKGARAQHVRANGIFPKPTGEMDRVRRRSSQTIAEWSIPFTRSSRPASRGPAELHASMSCWIPFSGVISPQKGRSCFRSGRQPGTRVGDEVLVTATRPEEKPASRNTLRVKFDEATNRSTFLHRPAVRFT